MEQQNQVSIPIVRLDGQGGVIFAHGGRSREQIREAILQLKDHLLAQPEHGRELPVEHEFADGMYLRKLFIPKGTILVGKIHRQPCMNIVASGDISLLTEFGVKRVQAGFTGASQAGIQKVGFAHEDTVFINVFRTPITDVEQIEAAIACESYETVTKELTCQ